MTDDICRSIIIVICFMIVIAVIWVKEFKTAKRKGAKIRRQPAFMLLWMFLLGCYMLYRLISAWIIVSVYIAARKTDVEYWNHSYIFGKEIIMQDAIRGSVIVIIGYTIATIIGLVKSARKAKKNGTSLKKSTALFIILWMAFWAGFMVYHFLTNPVAQWHANGTYAVRCSHT